MNTTLLKQQRRLTAAAAVALLALAAGCAEQPQMTERGRNTAIGAGVGAVAGAAIGKGTGGKAGTGAVIGGVAGAIAGNLWTRHMEDKRAQMERATQGTGIEVARTQDNQLKVNVPSDITFDTGRSDLKPQLRSVLDQFAQGLDRNTVVRVVGHTDSTGSDAINDPLSRARAESVARYLEDRGVPANRVEAVGRGEHEPIADNTSEAGRAKNRRVEIFLREPQQQG